MWKKLFQTDDDAVVLILRVLLGIVFFAHGMQKLFGWFGGYGFAGTMGWLTGLGVPWIFALLAVLSEGLGCFGLLAGIGTRIAAFGISINIVVASFLLHAPNSALMAWFVNKQNGMGLEYHVVIIAVAIALIIRGGGKWSIDRLIAGRLTS